MRRLTISIFFLIYVLCHSNCRVEDVYIESDSNSATCSEGEYCRRDMVSYMIEESSDVSFVDIDTDYGCQNRCSDSNISVCKDETTVIYCTDIDKDGCYEYVEKRCEPNTMCINGKCTKADCRSGDRKCLDKIVMICKDGLWVEEKNCSDIGRICSNGECVISLNKNIRSARFGRKYVINDRLLMFQDIFFPEGRDVGKKLFCLAQDIVNKD